ncbi:transposase family protein, partial [Microcystis aeruginosa]|uniref:transposase family protein n=1 Tax=Microcystis aeruginosa TaxID=1126 RepID=UPI000565DCD4
LEKEYNKALAKERIIIEHINRKLKTFKILSCKYRNRRRRYSLRVNLLAAIYNCELGIGIAASYTNSPKSDYRSLIPLNPP